MKLFWLNMQITYQLVLGAVVGAINRYPWLSRLVGVRGRVFLIRAVLVFETPEDKLMYLRRAGFIECDAGHEKGG